MMYVIDWCAVPARGNGDGAPPRFRVAGADQPDMRGAGFI